MLLLVPGASVITGLPLVFLSFFLILGQPSLWLPQSVAARTIEHARFSRIVAFALPHIERVERLAKPHFRPGPHRLVERLIGVAVLIMAVFMFLPIPFANAFPAVSVILLALALSERDGIFPAAGWIVAVVSCIDPAEPAHVKPLI